MQKSSTCILAILISITITVDSAYGAGIPKGAISTTGQWSTSDLPSGTGFLKASGGTPTYSSIGTGDLPSVVVRTDQSNTFGAFNQIFKASNFQIVDGSDASKIVTYDNSGMSGSRTLTIKPLSTTTQTLQIPNIIGTDTLATLGLTQTFTGTTTMDSLTLGGSENANSQRITSLGVPTVSTDAARADKLGIIGSIPTTACSTGQELVYDASAGAWSCGFARTLLGSTTLSSAANSITVSFTQGSYSKIDYEIYIPSISGGTSTMSMRFNGDTAANYAWAKIVTITSTTGTSATSCLLETTASSADRYIHVYEYNTPSNVIQGVRWEGSVVAATVATAPVMYQGTCAWAGNAQINSVTIFTTTTTRNFDPGSYVYVYGS